jgi:hypothetical protein
MLRAATFLTVPFLLALHALDTSAATIVPGTSNPNLAGRAGGYLCCGGDSSPPQDPVLVQETVIESCDRLEFTVTGKVYFDAGVTPGNNPDGDLPFDMTNYGDGLSAPLAVRANALVGVFLGDESPTGQPTPDQLSFAGEGGLAFGTISPEIGQIFFIGDGLSSDSNAGQTNGFKQHFVAPAGATQLFLGTADGSGWFNNSGSFTVEISSTDYDPPRPCGDPVDPPGLLVSDALRILRAAVGSSTCSNCYCDVDTSGEATASDSLVVLRASVGQPVELLCPCCLFL